MNKEDIIEFVRTKISKEIGEENIEGEDLNIRVFIKNVNTLLHPKLKLH